MKKCKNCPNEAHGRSGLCKPCKNEYNRNHYAANKQYYIDKAAERQKAIRQALRDIKEATPCRDCGINYPYYVMDFDHLQGKEFTIAGYTGGSLKRALDEVAKCDVVCSNCHRARTHARLAER